MYFWVIYTNYTLHVHVQYMYMHCSVTRQVHVKYSKANGLTIFLWSDETPLYFMTS